MKKLLILTLFITFQLSAQVEKIEPPFWWSGMNNTELQLLVYGENISELQPEFSDGIAIEKIKKVENPNYLFVTIDTENVSPKTVQLQFKKGKKIVQEFDYEFKERAENSAGRKGFDSSDVIYLLMPDRFANGNPKNDSTKNTAEKADRENNGGRHGGDIEGIIQHLDYIEELGATAIWSTPLLEDNEPRYSYHGYAQSDYYKIDPRFGSNDDYKRLADELHKREMKLLMDYVTNHWGSKHWLIQDLPSKDWIHIWENSNLDANGRDGFQRSNYRMTTQFDPNASQADAEGCMNGWFDTTMPDMNQSNPLVLNYMVQNAIWWIEFAGLDGFRVDTYSYNDKHGIAEWTKRIMDEYSNFNIVGEVWMHDQAQMAYWQKDSKIGAIDGYNSHLPSVMDFTLHDAIMQAFDENEQGWDTGAMRFYDNFANDFLYPNINNLLVFAGNHDTQRIQTVFGGDVNKYKLAMTLIATVRGIPQLYYGDEIGMEGDKGKGDGDIRRDFPGGWKGDTDPDNYRDAFTAEGRTETQKEYFNFTKKLLNWRKNKVVIHSGKTTHYIPQDNVYVYFRYNDEETVMVVLNNSDKEQSVGLKRFSKHIQDKKLGKEVISGQEFTLNEPLKVEAKSALIFELK
ncbi:glycoside hydrolase family 13 protein [Galbibacter sp. EGI 63066]|uniref:glycoside hydrolase family 13 protein n=1 Tax=Galbibacter sp. EGI 63066 TaxID=2993559 RepID=UPI002249933F|nr:glycoside hydrolase family 13 protein [Galbibacter sp. EGI 63066]MCX2679910.1 glycoside hydrolase family 13 protein [Galbibacter sp. EGI 63066]